MLTLIVTAWRLEAKLVVRSLDDLYLEGGQRVDYARLKARVDA